MEACKHVNQNEDIDSTGAGRLQEYLCYCVRGESFPSNFGRDLPVVFDDDPPIEISELGEMTMKGPFFTLRSRREI